MNLNLMILGEEQQPLAIKMGGIPTQVLLVPSGNLRTSLQ